ncbi:MAG: hypothetical protein COY75_05955 [Nitrospirae bacterium CG_4_10_14_0_8_um_filter_41_23]|nr:MAG: hypothetical protein AUK38_06125 [Nitrospirae bacterium CG2_30_41_42]PIQ94316.1 MAG: hypothetical protein COV68_05155 [Nitrospirae bacterium CG11_big_fil_rev_8_21_14_0_20_41_14]PIV44179.1 MAG: hypothetical protein COS27_02835 [Nitrospirae bacterium CG02_land_8_20_14_3_00_41_53]PIW87306.1 MAG: hypothetical protein COZ94_06020 [Nitrospirae bacterium CG_4_8_14_3_um_filter_41_47]PIY86801.1 MAG: hypothetical protein COY75_05955 [Nitrospirae bacterium CG_4_10_14_0_8_um_filter_41_23]PJA79436.
MGCVPIFNFLFSLFSRKKAILIGNRKILFPIFGSSENCVEGAYPKKPSPNPSHRGRGTNLEDSFQGQGLIAVSTEKSEGPFYWVALFS